LKANDFFEVLNHKFFSTKSEQLGNLFYNKETDMKIYNKSYYDYEDKIFKTLIKIKENKKKFEKVKLDKINKYEINNTNRSEIYIFPINFTLNYKNDYNIEIVNGSNLYFVLVHQIVF
jgi:hypothetical protein